MARPKKVARMTLRLDADVHRQVEEVGRLMHLDNNDVVHLLVHRGLGPLRTEAVLADYLREVSPAKQKKLFDNWRRKVGREPPEFLFFEELNKLALHKPNLLDGPVEPPSPKPKEAKRLSQKDNDDHLNDLIQAAVMLGMNEDKVAALMEVVTGVKPSPPEPRREEPEAQGKAWDEDEYGNPIA